ncbi:MAG: Snf7 family protein [Promethearchaeota archaeon]
MLEKKEKLAHSYIARKIQKEKQIEKLYKFRRKIAEQIDSIEEASTIQIAASALAKASSILKQYAKVIEALNLEEIITESEESLAVIEDATELIADDTMDIMIESEIDNELEELKAEVALEIGGKLTPAPDTGITSTSAIRDDVDEPLNYMEATPDDVKKELEKLKKELDLG